MTGRSAERDYLGAAERRVRRQELQRDARPSGDRQFSDREPVPRQSSPPGDPWWLLARGFQLTGLLDPAAGWQWVTGEAFGYTAWVTIYAQEPNDYWGAGTTKPG